MNQVGLKFLLSDGHFLLVVVPDQEAVRLGNLWLGRSTERVYGACQVTGVRWFVDLEAVKALHTFDPAQLQQPQQAPQPPQRPFTGPGRPGPGVSGFNN